MVPMQSGKSLLNHALITPTVTLEFGVHQLREREPPPDPRPPWPPAPCWSWAPCWAARTPRAQGAGHEAGGIQRGQDPSAPAKWDGGGGRYGKWGVYISITYNQIYICTNFRVTDGTGCAMVVMVQWMSQSNGCHKALAWWHPLLCDTHCSVTAIAWWHPLLCGIRCSVTAIALWYPLLDTPLKRWKLKMWKRSFRARLPHPLLCDSHGCHKAMAVTEQWVSQSSGCHQAMAVTEQWMWKSRTKASFSHLQLSPFEGSIKQWISQSNGCHRATDATK